MDNSDHKMIQILFYNVELLKDFRLTDTYEYTNLITSCIGAGVKYSVHDVTEKSRLRKEIEYGTMHGKLFSCDSQYNEPFSGWQCCFCNVD